MGLFEQFPYTNFHNLNLDWLINEIKNLGNQAVLSVNGMTGDVVLYKSENIVFPEVEADTWRMVRIADGHTAGVMFQNGLMYVMFDNAAERVYTVEHPPTFPVTSVNGQTGAVELYQDAGVRLPDVTDDYTNVRRQIQTNGVDNIVGIEVKADKAYRMKDTQRAEIYDALNQPPYPVTSVNGQTGAIMLAIPFANVNVDDVMFTQAAAGHEWSIGRETPDGTASIQIRTDASKAEAWIDFFTDTTPQVTYTRKLLTTDDIPSGSGVVSINGLSGVVTLTGSDIMRNSSSQDSVEDVLISLEADLGDAQDDIDDLQGDMTTAQGNITALQNTVSGLSGGAGLAYIVDGDTANAAVPAGAYAYIKNNTHSLADGYYQNTSASSFPVSGGTADSTVFTAVPSEGVLNTLNNKINQYSTSEVAVGTWIDGSTIYRKVYYFGALPNNTTAHLSSGLSGIATKIIKLEGLAYDRSQTYNVRPLPLADPTTANCIRLDMIADSRFQIRTGSDWSAYDAYIYVEYIK